MILISTWNRKKIIFYTNGSSYDVSHTNPNPECEVNVYGGWVWVIHLLDSASIYHRRAHVKWWTLFIQLEPFEPGIQEDVDRFQAIITCKCFSNHWNCFSWWTNCLHWLTAVHFFSNCSCYMHVTYCLQSKTESRHYTFSTVFPWMCGWSWIATRQSMPLARYAQLEIAGQKRSRPHQYRGKTLDHHCHMLWEANWILCNDIRRRLENAIKLSFYPLWDVNQ